MALSKRLTYQGDLLVDDKFDEVSMSDGSYSWLFDGNTQQINVPHNVALAFSNSNWTIEFWALPTATDTLSRTVYSKRANAGIFSGVTIYCNGGSGRWEFQVANITGTTFTVNNTATVTADIGVWQHIALVRSGVNIYAYKNGVRSSLSSAMSSNVIFDDGTYAIIGSLGNAPVSSTTSTGSWRFRGYLSNFRITKGTALYTTATIAIPYSPLLSQGTITSLLTCQSPTFKDNSSYAHAIYDSNTPVISYKNPFTTEKSVNFNGVSQYLSLTDNAVFQYGIGNFTIEAWVYLTSSSFPSTQKRFWSQQNTGISTVCWVGVSNALKFSAEIRSSTGTLDTQISGTTTVQLNTWYHVAFVRYGTNTYLFVNGVLEATSTDQSQSLAASIINIGSYNNGASDYWSGYISNLRVIKGTSVYVPTITVPTTQLTAVSGTSLLTCQSSTIVDNSPNNFTITNTTANFVFPPLPLADTYYNSFNGTSYISMPAAAGVASYAGDFTIEFWFYANSLPSAGNTYALASQLKLATGRSWRIQLDSAGTLIVSGVVASGAGAIVANAWYHVAWTKDSTANNLYINGTLAGTAASSTPPASTDPVFLGATNDSASPIWLFPGYISNFRIVKGTEVYTGAFTPPTSPLRTTQSAGTNIAAITDPTQVSILTCQSSNVIVDNSPNNFTITNTNTVVAYRPPYSSFYAVTPFSSRYLSAPASSAFDFGTGNFTIECWAYKNTGSTNDLIITNRTSVSATPNGCWWIDTVSSVIRFAAYNSVGTQYQISGGSIDFPVAQWFHIAAVKSGSTITCYLNGAAFGSVSVSGSFGTSSSGIYIGSFTDDSTWAWNGHISNVRIVKGVAVYTPTTTFTPSTKPLPAISGTSLLTCQTPLVRNDNSINNLSINATGSPRISDLSPFESNVLTDESSVPAVQRLTNSVSFGNTQRSSLSVGTSSLLALGAGDFTIETWVYPTSWNSLTSIIWDYRTDGGSGTRIPVLYFSIAGIPTFNITAGVSAAITSSTAATLNAWNHIAIVRSGSTVTMYLNGSSVGTATSSGDYGIATLSINNPQTFANYIQPGYFSNFRIVVGTAVYTGNFTVPTSPLRTTQSAGTNIAAITDESQVRLLTCQDYGEFTDNSIYNWYINTLPTALTTSNREIPATSVFNPFDSTDQNPIITDNYFSTRFGGSGYYLSNPTNLGFDFGTGDFTLEAWIYPINAGRTFDATKYGTIISQFVAGSITNSWGWAIGISAGGVLDYMSFETGGTNRLTVSGLSYSINTWHHVACVRNNGTISFYINGVSVGSVSYGSAISYNASAVVNIGRSAYAGVYENWLKGYISNVRVVKGIPVYTSNFTPPTSPLTAIGGTQLLTCQSPVTTQDNSTTNLVITAPGAGADHFNPFKPTTAYYSTLFNGSSQYITAPGNATAFGFGTGNFTIEFWVNPSVLGAARRDFIDMGDATSTGPLIWWSSSETLQYYQGGALITSAVGALTVGVWQHVAVVRSSGSTKMYVNGIQVGSTYADTKNYTGTGTVFIGRNQGAAVGFVNGYMSNVRVVKGVAVYTNTFTPPTSPLTAISGTTLLTCQSSITIDESTIGSVLTSTGSATISNSVVPYTVPTPDYKQQPEFPVSKELSSGMLMTSSYLNDHTLSRSTANEYYASFDGSSKYLSAPNGAGSALGTTTDFTFETWIYPTTLTPGGGGLSNGVALIGAYGTTGVITGFFFGFLSTGALYFSSYVSGTQQFLTATTNFISTNSWQHVAITRSGSTYRMFVNGVSVTFTGSVTQSLNTSNAINIGGLLYDTYYDYLTGYMSNVRIVKGTALYTANFSTADLFPLKAVSGTSLLTCQSSTIVDNSINNFTITNTGSVTTTSATGTTLVPAVPLTGTKQKQYATGVIEIAGQLDDYTGLV
jgi:hypothetical protein